jgi:serine/threonine-protein kinase
MPFTIGQHIGDYEITGTLGAGGMGQVYRVRHTISHRIEAMKVLAPGRPLTDDLAGRFLREIQLLASLHHPNIIELHTAFRHNGQLIMIMEFVEGVTLSVKTSHNQLMFAAGLNYIQQVLSGLAYAHEQGIIHRDIKPSNIMIGKNDQVKLLDFGLALPTLGPEFTRTGIILGSVHYMAPEQVSGKPIDARTDLYTVGVTLYQMLTGKLPFNGRTEYDIATSHLNADPVDPFTINPNIPVRLSKIVMKSLAKSPESRFQTAREFLDALTSLPTGETKTLSIATLPTTTPGQAFYLQTPQQEGARPSASPERKAIEISVLDSVIRDLAFHVGPIAKVIVNRAAKQASTLDDLFAVLSNEISTENKRQDFLATRTKYSVTK